MADVKHAKKLKRIAFILVAAGLVLAITGIIGTYFLTFPGVEIERVSFTTEPYDTPPRTVSGLLIKPDDPVEIPTPAVIFCHGSHLSKEVYLGAARELARQGLVVLTIDLRGHGGTGGTSDWGFSEMRDVWAAADFLSTLDGVDAERIAVTGHSLGGVTATRAGLFQEDGKITVTAPVWCYPGGRESMEEMSGPIDDLTGPLWPFMATSRVFDIRDPEELEKRRIIDSVTADRPPNFQLVAGTRDEFMGVGPQQELVEAAAGVVDLERGRTYGSFEDGTARRFVVTEDTHGTQVTSPETWGAVSDWIFRGFGLDEPSPVSNAPTYRMLFWALVLFGFLAVAIGCIYGLRFLLGEDGNNWSPRISTDRNRDYRILAGVSVLLYFGVSFAAFPLARALGIRAFIPFAGLVDIVGPDVFSSQAAAHIIMLVVLIPALAYAAKRWGLSPFNRPESFSRLFRWGRPDRSAEASAAPEAGSSGAYEDMGLGSKLLVGTVPFAVLLVLYIPTAHGLHLARGMPISIWGSLAFFAVLAVYLFLEGHFFQAFLLPAWGSLDSRWRRVSYVVSEGCIRALGLTFAFIPIVGNPMVMMGGAESGMRYPLFPTALLLGLVVFIPVSALTFLFRRRGYGVSAVSIGIALFATWVFSTLVAVRMF